MGVSFNRTVFTRRKFFSAALSIPISAATDAIAIEPHSLRIRQIRLSTSPSCRLVHVTDIHHKGDRTWLEKVVTAINDQQPNFVCFTGDLIEDAHHAPEALEILSRIQAPLFGIPGNHDHWADLDFDLPREAFAKTGGRWLMNEEAALPSRSIRLFGLDGTRYHTFKPPGGSKNILLAHYPASVETIDNGRFDLILAGHSHGGQVRIPGYGAVITPSLVGSYQLGFYDTPAGPLYVNPGVGWFYANLRLFCRPEITVFEL